MGTLVRHKLTNILHLVWFVFVLLGCLHECLCACSHYQSIVWKLPKYLLILMSKVEHKQSKVLLKMLVVLLLWNLKNGGEVQWWRASGAMWRAFGDRLGAPNKNLKLCGIRQRLRTKANPITISFVWQQSLLFLLLSYETNGASHFALPSLLTLCFL